MGGCCVIDANVDTRNADRLLSAIGAVAWEFDWSTGCFLFVNDACERLLGYPRERWLEPGFWAQRVHPDDLDEAAGFCRASTEQGLDHVFEYRMVHADGRVIWVRDIVTVDPVKRLDGVLRGLFVDITDTKRKAEQFEAVFRLLRDLFFRIDRDGLIVEYEAPGDNELYVPPAAFLGKRLEDVLPPDVGTLLNACRLEAARTGRAATGEYTLEMNGRLTHWEARFFPLQDGESAVVCRDITVRKQQEAEIRAQRDDLDRTLSELTDLEARFRHTFERAPIGVHLYERKGDEVVFAGANPAGDRILGIDSAPLIGKPIAEAFPQLDVFAEAHRHLAEQGGQWHAEVPYADDRIKGVFDVTAFRTSPGHVAVMFLDITERKAIENADREHNRKVAALAAQIAAAEDVERRRLAEELHDRVSQPLAVARMRLQAAVRSCPHESPDAGQALEMLDQAIAETRAITTELYPPVLTELGLCAALGWLADEFCRMYGLVCTTRLDGDASGLPDDVQGFLFRTARELLSNVVKHAGTERVWVSLDRLGDRVALTVTDEGRGFAPGSAVTGDGSGFGLFSIAERIGYFGGDLDIESTPGEGARVTVTVPLSR